MAEKAGRGGLRASRREGVAHVEQAVCASSPAASARTTSSWPPAGTPTARSSWPPGWRGTAARVVDIGKTPARPAVERLLREGARRPVLPVLRPRALRRPLRARGHRLPGGLRALDRAPQPGVLPRPRSPASRSTWARWSPTCADRRRRRGLRAAAARRACTGVGFLFEYPDTSRGRERGGTGGGRARVPAHGEAGRPARAAEAPVRLGVRRRGQLRDVDAAAAPGAATTASTLATVATTTVAVRGQRAAQVRLRRR